jgi:hypothetical protein
MKDFKFQISDFGLPGGSAAPRAMPKNIRLCRLTLASSSPWDESVRLADKGLLDPPAAPSHSTIL